MKIKLSVDKNTGKFKSKDILDSLKEQYPNIVSIKYIETNY